MQVATATSTRSLRAPSSTSSPSSTPSAFSPELLVDASVALPRLVAAIRGARHVVNISMYSWLDSGSGATLARLVEAKAREGVEVNVMLDGRGSMVAPGLRGAKLVASMRSAGVNVVVNDSLLPGGGRAVDHTKMYSIDGRTGFIGGMNLSQTYDGWQDAMATLDHRGAIDAGRDFLARWTARGGTVSAVNERLVLHPVDAPETGSMEVIANNPRTGAAPITDAYLAAMRTATDRLWVETPFLGSQAMVDALAGAARRGVDVRLLTNGPATAGAVPGINLLGAGFYAQLVQAGVKVYQQGSMTHSKVLLADNAAIVGSFNLTTRSASGHHEISMRSSDRAFVGQVAGMFDADMGAARLVTAADLDRTGQRVLTRLREWLRLQY